MMDLGAQVRAAFTVGGSLSNATDGFKPRQGQWEMAMAVSDTIESGGALVVEAGTGIGKTFAYLVPALLSGKRTLVSTATKALQDQLYTRDLPRLIEALKLPVQSALLKGRSSYLCLHRMGLAPHEISPTDRTGLRALAKVQQWAQVTQTGDMAEISGLDERSGVLPLVTSTRENCLGSNCPQFKACHVSLARREALAADVVVVNHHLFFADLAVRESGMAELLPSVDIAVFDEAHQLNETGVNFLGKQLGTAPLLEFSRDMLAAGLTSARGLVDWQTCSAGVERATRDLRLVVGKQLPNARLRWIGRVPDGLDESQWDEALEVLQSALDLALEALGSVSEISPDFVRLYERGAEHLERCKIFLAPCAKACVRWVEAGVQIRLVESPLDIADTVRSRMLKISNTPLPQDAGEPRKQAWVFTSATLGDDAGLSWFTKPCGLDGHAQVLKVESPFDYALQAAVYVPLELPRPNDANHSLAVARWAADAARRLGGRTLVLTTTLRALRAVGEEMANLLDGAAIDVLVQGNGTKRELVERFRAAGEWVSSPQANAAAGAWGAAPKGCVLVASASFWEGIDLPGDVLQLVVIDKLPFPPPGDPLVEARTQRLEAGGGNPFKDYFVPEAAVSLKQGAGRLIRRESDSGMLAICDTRLRQMGYGKRLLDALPPMRRLVTQAECNQALDALRVG